MRAIFLLLISCVAASWAGADFDAGNRAYDEEKYLEARQHYEAAVTHGEYSANLFYNLGNADERLGAVGLAVLNYERALALDPRHTDAQANLKYLRQQSLAKLPTRTWQDAVFGVFSYTGWVRLTATLGWVSIFLLAIPFALRRRLDAGGVFALVLAICGTAFAGCGVWLNSTELEAGVIIAKQAEARQGASDRATLADVLPAGSRVRVLSVRGDWTYCTLPGGGTGWVPSASVERIRLPS